MGTDDAKRVYDIFQQALETEPAHREAWLDQACGGDAALRAKVEKPKSPKTARVGVDGSEEK